LTGAKALNANNSGEVDHIFPRSILRTKGFDESLINHFANFWILAKGKNQNKSNRPPATYFKDVSESELKRAFIDRDLLDYSHFRKFLQTRGGEIIESIKQKLDFSESDFQGVSIQAKLTALGIKPEVMAAMIARKPSK
jgi:hypothetical protein